MRSPLLLAFLFAGLCNAADPSPEPVPSGRIASLEALITSLDTDKDGQVGKAEASGRFATRFSDWDANGDGFATRQEIHDFREKLGINNNGQRRSAKAIAAAALLPAPEDWRLEQISLPPAFAPGVKLRGQEEIRFAPGMFDPSADDYFTCIIAIVADSTTAVSASDLQDFLEKYYGGLSTAVGSRKGFQTDPDRMKATVAPQLPGTLDCFTAEVGFFDPFTDGRHITLHIEASQHCLPAGEKVGLILLVSPSAKDTQVWTNLRKIGERTEQHLTSPN